VQQVVDDAGRQVGGQSLQASDGIARGADVSTDVSDEQVTQAWNTARCRSRRGISRRHDVRRYSAVTFYRSFN